MRDRLGVSDRWMLRAIETRLIPFHKVGKWHRYDPRDVDAYLAERRVEAREP